jgi:hypothetical protein
MDNEKPFVNKRFITEQKEKNKKGYVQGHNSHLNHTGEVGSFCVLHEQGWFSF